MLDDTTRAAILEVRDEASRQGIVATFSLHRERSHLMRIGNNSVSLNTSEDLTRLDIGVTDGRRQGSQTLLGRIDTADVVRAVLETARAKAAMAMPKAYEPLRDRVERPIAESAQYDPDLAGLDPAVKAAAYRRLMAEVGGAYNYSGSWSSGVTEQYLATTADANEAWHLGTDQHFTVVLKHPEKSWELRGTQTGWRASDMQPDRVAAHLRDLLPVFEGTPAVRNEPGPHTVIFGAEALADIVMFAAWTGLTGSSWEEKQGWTAKDAVGDRILGPNVTIVDDPENDDTFRFGFDLAGKTRRRFPLVDAGALAGLMYTSSTAAKYSREPTGHDVDAPSLAVLPGDGPPDPMAAVAGHDRVLYIPALHYMNIANRSEGVFTASSRFGAVIVERGTVAAPMYSSRITDGFRNVLGRIAVLSSATTSVNQSNTYGRRFPTAMSVPTYAVADGVKITDCAASF